MIAELYEHNELWALFGSRSHYERTYYMEEDLREIDEETRIEFNSILETNWMSPAYYTGTHLVKNAIITNSSFDRYVDLVKYESYLNVTYSDDVIGKHYAIFLYRLQGYGITVDFSAPLETYDKFIDEIRQNTYDVYKTHPERKSVFKLNSTHSEWIIGQLPNGLCMTQKNQK